MRVLLTALAISAAVHGAAIAWVETRPDPEPEPAQLVTVAPVEILPAPTAEPQPTEVTLLDDHTVAAIARAASSPSHTRSRRKDSAHASISATASSATIETGRTMDSHAEASKPPRSKLMTMRHPKLERGPSADFWSKFAANTKPLAPKDTAGEQLAHEIATAEDNLKNPKWVANATPGQLAAEREKLVARRYEKTHAELKPDGQGTKAEHRTFNMRFNGDGTVGRIDDKANIQRKGLGGSFDVTDAMMRSQGIDPYSSAKLKVLDETREERVAIGKRYRTQQLAQSRQHVQKHLDRLWATTGDLAERKRALFELWDDCAESGRAELVAGGRAAREQVIGFIRSKLPAPSAHAFTRDELARFNKQRKSRATFSPYE